MVMMRNAQTTAQTLAAQPVYEITDEDKKRQKRICDAWCAYKGELDPPLQKMPGQPDDNVLTNRCQAIVDRGIDFLFGKEVEISVEEAAPEDAQDFLNTTWGIKETRIPLLQKLAMSGAISGQGFLRIVPDNKGNYRLVVIDPETIFIQTSPQDCETVLLFCIQYSTPIKNNGHPEQMYYREEINRIDPDGNALQGMPDSDDTWQIQHWTRIGDRGNWTAVGEPISWPYEFPPIFCCQNLPNPHEFWGLADITPDLIGVNQALNFVQSNINRVNKLYGAPLLFSNNTGEQVLDIKPGRIANLPPEGKISSVSFTSDLANALQFASDLRSDIDEQSSVPAVATGRLSDVPRGTVSGVALQLLFMPLLKKTDKKRCLYGELMIEVSQALLVLNNMSGDLDISLGWQSPLPSDDLPTVQTALLKQQVGVSETTLLRELGYDPDEEAELKKNEDANTLVNFSKGQGMPAASSVPPAPPNVEAPEEKPATPATVTPPSVEAPK